MSDFSEYELSQERSYGEIPDRNKTYYVVDIADDFVLYSGNLSSCRKFQDENYAGLVVLPFSDLTEKMINSILEPF